MAASAKKIHKTRPNAGVSSYVIADGVTLYEGQLVQLKSGYLDHWDKTGQFVGILVGGDDRAGDGVIVGETSDTPAPEGRVNESGVILMHVAVGGSPTIADVGGLIYCNDSDVANLTKTDAANAVVGRLVRFRSASDCDVQLFTPAEHLAGEADATWNS